MENELKNKMQRKIINECSEICVNLSMKISDFIDKRYLIENIKENLKMIEEELEQGELETDERWRD